jgi:hypothetical protein
MIITEPWKIVAVIAASLAGHRRDYPEASEAVESITVNLPDALGMSEGERAEFTRWVHTDPEWKAAPRPEDVQELLDDAWHAMGDGGSNDEEHDALYALTDWVAQLYDIKETES